MFKSLIEFCQSASRYFSTHDVFWERRTRKPGPWQRVFSRTNIRRPSACYGFTPKKLFPILLIFAALPIGTSSGQSASTVPATSKELGKVDVGKVVEHEFEIKNDGVSPLVLSIKSKSCGCVTASAPEDVPAGGVGKIKVSTKASRVGRGSASATFTTNDPKAPEITLRMNFEAVGEITIGPPVAWQTQEEPGEAEIISITLEGRDDAQSFRILDVRLPNAGIQVMEPTVFPTGPARKHVLKLMLSDSEWLDGGREIVSVRTSNSEMPFMEIPIDRPSLSPYGISPNELVLGVTHPQEVANLALEVTRKDGKPFHILSIDQRTRERSVSLRFKKEDEYRNQHRVVIGVETPKAPGAWKAEIVLHLADQLGEGATLSVRAVGVVTPTRPSGKS